MYIYVELWKPKQAWLEMPPQDRTNYLDQLGPAIQKLLDMGIEMLSWSINDADTPYPVNYPYFAIWKMPNKDAVLQFEQVVDEAGWHNYFEQVNARGMIGTPQDVLAKLATVEAQP